MNSKSKYWCLTDNTNILHEYWVHKVNELKDVVDYCKGQLEMGEETKHAHVQAFFCFKTARTFGKVKEWFPNAHLEIKSARSSIDQAADYCGKAESRVPVEQGGYSFEVAVIYSFRPCVTMVLRSSSAFNRVYRLRRFYFHCEHEMFKCDMDKMEPYLCVHCWSMFR